LIGSAPGSGRSNRAFEKTIWFSAAPKQMRKPTFASSAFQPSGAVTAISARVATRSDRSIALSKPLMATMALLNPKYATSSKGNLDRRRMAASSASRPVSLSITRNSNAGKFRKKNRARTSSPSLKRAAFMAV